MSGVAGRGVGCVPGGPPYNGLSDCRPGGRLRARGPALQRIVGRTPSSAAGPLAGLLLFCALPLLAGGRKTDVVTSKHNLSVTGSPVSSAVQDVCYFCHTPHSSDVNTKPLWNHKLSAAAYSAYTSSTYNAAAGVPSAGASRLCLSCHDGTVALGATDSAGTIATTGAMSALSTLGTDLTNDHPVGMPPVDDGQLAASLFQLPPTTRDPAVTLDSGRIECKSCHDPHSPNLDAAAGKFLVRSNSGGAMCLACHDPSRAQPNALSGWSTSSHATAANTAPQTPPFGPYGAVSANACGNCHSQHGTPAAAARRLLNGPEEGACSPCHSGANLSPVLLNVMGEFSKTYRHPTTTTSGVHDPTESVAPVNAARHAECPDCHNSHAATSSGGAAGPPGLESALLGASGYNGVGALKPAVNEFEVCYKCHADSTNKPQRTAGYSAYGRTVVRVTDAQVPDPYNLRLNFASTVSRHPVTSPRIRTAAQVPSLRAAILNTNGTAGRSLGAGAYIYCSDCHNNDQSRKSAGAGPNGPHGSTWTHLLEREYDQETPPSGSVSSATAGSALCNKCHDVSGSVLADRSFSRHQLHAGSVRASCSTCHEPHGIQGGTVTNNYSLVNFDTAIVTVNSSGILRWTSNGAGTFHGRCDLRCHGQNHSYTY